MAKQLGIYERVEGCDGAGKTTQMGHLKQYSQEKGIDALFIREPGASSLGEKVRAIVLANETGDLDPAAEFTLFTADRIQTYHQIIAPALAEDRLVISDRGVESTVCYQSATGHLSAEVIMDISRKLLPLRYMQPDVLALLSITKEVRRQRLNKRFEHTAADRMELKGESYDDRVYAAYQDLSKLDYVTTIDGNRDEEQVFEDLKPVIFGKYMRDHSGIFLPTYTKYDAPVTEDTSVQPK